MVLNNMEWIQTKDKLPSEEVLAIVAFDFGYGLCNDYVIAHCDTSNGKWYTRENHLINVTHWIPLPKLPTINKE
jgi:hypothetical protein